MELWSFLCLFFIAAQVVSGQTLCWVPLFLRYLFSLRSYLIKNILKGGENLFKSLPLNTELQSLQVFTNTSYLIVLLAN